jgi:hypothetical protein
MALDLGESSLSRLLHIKVCDTGDNHSEYGTFFTGPRLRYGASPLLLFAAGRLHYGDILETSSNNLICSSPTYCSSGCMSRRSHQTHEQLKRKFFGCVLSQFATSGGVGRIVDGVTRPAHMFCYS